MSLNVQWWVYVHRNHMEVSLLVDSVCYFVKLRISALIAGLTAVWGWIFFAVLSSTTGGAEGFWQAQFTLSSPRAAIYFETWLVWAVYCHQKEEETLDRIAEKAG